MREALVENIAGIYVFDADRKPAYQQNIVIKRIPNTR